MAAPRPLGRAGTDLHLLIGPGRGGGGPRLHLWAAGPIEYDEIRHDGAPEDRYRLYTLLNQKPRLVCSPDYLFTLTAVGRTKVFLGELERGTSHPEKAAAAEKSPGYAELFRRRMHKRFCPDAMDVFTVLVTAPDAKWRDHLVKAFATKQEPTLYRVAAQPDPHGGNLFPPTGLEADGRDDGVVAEGHGGCPRRCTVGRPPGVREVRERPAGASGHGHNE